MTSGAKAALLTLSLLLCPTAAQAAVLTDARALALGFRPVDFLTDLSPGSVVTGIGPGDAFSDAGWRLVCLPHEALGDDFVPVDLPALNRVIRAEAHRTMTLPDLLTAFTLSPNLRTVADVARIERVGVSTHNTRSLELHELQVASGLQSMSENCRAIVDMLMERGSEVHMVTHTLQADIRLNVRWAEAGPSRPIHQVRTLMDLGHDLSPFSGGVATLNTLTFHDRIYGLRLDGGLFLHHLGAAMDPLEDTDSCWD